MERDFFVSRITDPSYPNLLKEIHSPPKELMVRGGLPDASLTFLAVVGSRKCSPYGKQVTQDLVRILARSGIIIVSGLAMGIDEIAHRATIDAGGTTVAVLGFGIQHKGTYREERLQNDILASGGALISEFPPDLPGHKGNFPQRNRLISGMCHGTLVVEAGERSGSIITARLTMEQNRDLFVVPGPITSPTSAGTNRFLKEGAIPVTEPDDILNVLFPENVGVQHATPVQPPPDLTDAQRSVYDLLSTSPTHIDDIIRRHQSPGNVVSALLTTLEINGCIHNVGGNRFVIK